MAVNLSRPKTSFDSGISYDRPFRELQNLSSVDNFLVELWLLESSTLVAKLLL